MSEANKALAKRWFEEVWNGVGTRSNKNEISRNVAAEVMSS